ncbi:hypothetical protein RM572_21895 [Streptomyces sp. DSM 42041]|uniref:Uncharacterized protein n=1 Tax=Streptomyces hazeniae TaxID=3075538 RepID=A0ABU2NXJ2_9ACTN|nr:hypothetical protein [Streptomyces sp. DSM 42041]MDT0381415.1 hypothetical protein [Streptomyces sp. DSM 42041]
MPFRRTMSTSELREKQKASGGDNERHATTYQPSRGGWFKSSKPEPKPKP